MNDNEDKLKLILQSAVDVSDRDKLISLKELISTHLESSRPDAHPIHISMFEVLLVAGMLYVLRGTQLLAWWRKVQSQLAQYNKEGMDVNMYELCMFDLDYW